VRGLLKETTLGWVSIISLYGTTYSLRSLLTNALLSIYLKSVKGSKTQPGYSGVKPQETPELHHKIP